MKQPCVDDRVLLVEDIPELMLFRGELGIVRSTWFAPFTRYEVEFERADQGLNTRALLRCEQIAIEEESYSVQAHVDADQAWIDPVGV